MPAHRTKENQGIVATESRHTVEGMARGKKKRKSPPKKKAPNKKRETAACGSTCLRAAAPPSSLASFLSSFGGCAASFYYPLRASLSSCGRLRRPSSLLLLSRFLRAAAPPYPFRFSSSSLPLLRRLRRLSPPRSRGRLAPPPRPLLFPLYQKINKLLTPSQVINFFLLPSSLIKHCVDVLGYTALNLKAFGHKFLSFGKFFLLIRKKFVPL